ncbi:cobalamin biosynthesis protein [Methanobrevibacter sp.]|uniref:cobalamin biosynthesis protein n=1 Tax=Methanobrevibacter sp. TaxID=66852 RepID=UPI0025F30F22|nr:cobalamin biosynthesis protein [Methanobrevibacter sp.]MBQ2665521.1 cobalamin biosynthesis protein [Methanobrevibacter sp.]
MIEYNGIVNDIIGLKLTSMELFIFIVSALVLSLAIDVIFGELPTRIHPVVIIGSLIDFFKKLFIEMKNRLSGLLVVIGVCAVSSVILYIIYLFSSLNGIILFIIFSILLSSTFSVKMLIQTAIDVKKALDDSIEKARKLVSYLVSRDTEELTESFIVSATIESLTENITDSYVAPVFYYFIFGLIILHYPIDNSLFYLLLIPMFYRISNTMDAMLGYKSEELSYIGYFPAKIDDVLNYIPARISGIFVVFSAYLLGLDGKNAYKIMMRDARKCPSPNSGYTMATTAGALNIQLIKKETYILGDDNKDITADDISKAVKLSKTTIILYTITIILLFALLFGIL